MSDRHDAFGNETKDVPTTDAVTASRDGERGIPRWVFWMIAADLLIAAVVVVVFVVA